MAERSSGKSFELQVQAHLAEADTAEKRPEVAAYAYSAGGKLLASEPLDPKGSASLKLTLPQEATSIRVVVGPGLEEKAASLEGLLRRGAHEQRLRVEAKDLRASVRVSVLADRWRCWFAGICAVRGTLLKRVMSGGIGIDLPVCHARVEIFEVDPLWILVPRLPDDVLARLRDLIIRPPPPLPDPISDLTPVPIPHPGPGPDPGPLAVRTPSGSLDEHTATALRQLSETASVRLAAQAGSTQQLQQALIDHAQLVRPLLCWFFPRFVTMQKVGEAWTDDCGRFQTFFFKGCNNPDVPDLYFKAYQRIFGLFEVQIYGPLPVACYTWWNYTCGTEVTLLTTSPLAVTCSPCAPVIAPENWVLFTAIGNTSLKSIHGGGAAATTAANWGLLTNGAPWGGTLRPRLDFDNSLRESLGVLYYQMSWRKGTSGGWTPLQQDVYRHYVHVINSDLVIEPYKLGPNPKVVDGQTLQLYEIPPAVPPIGQWTIANAVLDTENAEFDSVASSPGLSFDKAGAASGSDESGLYQLKLELFDAAGKLVDIAGKGIKFVVPDTESLTGTIPTVNADTIPQPGGGSLVVGNSLILTLHVDNNHCWAGLAAPVTPSGAADSCCGMVPYAPGESVSMPYTAHHPHGFATHALNIFRSATQILPTITGGVGSFTVTRTVADMMALARPAECLSKPVCAVAAFSEHLEVYAMATDGWGSYLGYNAVADRAFGLALTT